RQGQEDPTRRPPLHRPLARTTETTMTFTGLGVSPLSTSRYRSRHPLRGLTPPPLARSEGRSRIQAAAQFLARHLLDAQAQRRRAHGQLPPLGQVANVVEGVQHQLAQLVVDLRLAPHQLLDVLHPLEV